MDEWTRAIAEVRLRQYDSEYSASHLTWEDFTGEAQEIVAALAPLIEARVREAEEQRDEVSGRLSELLCDLTGGLLSKPGYDVPTMTQAVEDHFERTVVAAAWQEGYTSGHSNAMRQMSDEPNAPTTPNPYRAEEVRRG